MLRFLDFWVLLFFFSVAIIVKAHQGNSVRSVEVLDARKTMSRSPLISKFFLLSLLCLLCFAIETSQLSRYISGSTSILSLKIVNKMFYFSKVRKDEYFHSCDNFGKQDFDLEDGEVILEQEDAKVCM